MSAAVGRHNLLELRDAHRELFWPQVWFVGEAFMRVLPSEPALVGPPIGVLFAGKAPMHGKVLPARAVDLAHVFVRYPDAAIWRDHWLWCDDTDALGQRVYVGAPNGRLEIHRHLHLTEKFGVPSWRWAVQP